MDPTDLWKFLPAGYALSIAIETPILLAGLSPPHGLGRRLFAGVWLTACTYPIVVLVLPLTPGLSERWRYLLVAETFAPLAECVLFTLAFHRGANLPMRHRLRDWLTIVLANLASFLLGSEIIRLDWWPGG